MTELMYTIVYKKADGWDGWYCTTTALQTDRATAETLAENHLKWFKDNGWITAVVKVAEVTFLD